jgi:hypothetical protein
VKWVSEPLASNTNDNRLLKHGGFNRVLFGWVVQDRKDLNLYAGPGVAVREVIMARGHGRADYLLYADQLAAGRPGRHLHQGPVEPLLHQ